MNYFSFNGVACTYAGVTLQEPVGLFKPRTRGEYITVPGRNGQLFADEGAADVNETMLQIWVRPDADVHYVRRWLSGAGRLKTQEGSAYSYDAIISEGYQLTPLRDNSGYTAIVPVTLSPYQTQDEATRYSFSGSGLIVNQTGIKTPARLVLRGGGEAYVSINGREVSFESFTDGTEVDGTSREAYIGSTVVSSQMSGEWPYLDPGNNSIVLGGGLTGAEIYVQWPL